MSVLTLKQACREACANRGGIEQVARLTGIRSLQQKLNDGCERNKLSSEDIDSIIQVTRGHEVLDALCSRVDAAWVDMSGLRNLACDSSMLDNVTDLVTRMGALTRKVQLSLADGVVDEAEMADLEKLAQRLMGSSLAVVERSRQFMAVTNA
ncbi:MAG: phage regulatory CII family protein [Bermanella sp.]